MKEFVLKEVISNIEDELGHIGFDTAYRKSAVFKFKYKNFKIFKLSIPQANILKQTAISVGADCAVHRETITAKVENTDCLLGGSLSQLKKISAKLRKQPFGLSKLADLIDKHANLNIAPIIIKKTLFDYNRPYIVGILNLTKDSFSDGGKYFDFDSAITQLKKIIDEGADIIEIGAESTRPSAKEVPAEEQLKKLLPILDFIKKEKIMTPISVDTRSSIVAQKCVEAGADIINDVSGFKFDSNMAATLAELNVPVIIQHSRGIPETMENETEYSNLMDDVFCELKFMTDYAIKAGISPDKIIVDVGIGFAKSDIQSFELIDRIKEIFSLGFPVMVGVSRKGLLGMSKATNKEKDIYTLALNSILINSGVNFIRVHDVALHKKLISLLSKKQK